MFGKSQCSDYFNFFLAHWYLSTKFSCLYASSLIFLICYFKKKKGGGETCAAQCKIFAHVLLIQLLPSRTERCKIKQWCSGRADR